MRYFTAFLLFAISLFAQSPDVAQYLTFTAATAGAPVFVGAGGPNGAVAWRLTYYVDGTAITAAQVAIQGADAPTAAGCSVGGLVWTTIITAGSSLVEVANPSASAPQGNVAVKSFYPCIRANVTAITGAAGTVKTVLYGYKTVWVFPTPAIVIPSGTQDVNLIQIDGTAATVNTGNAGAGTQRVVLASDQPAVAVTPAANSTVDVAKVGGTAVTVNTGNAGAGTQRVVLASDQPAVAVTPAANSTVDVAKVGGTAVTVNTGNAGAGTQRVVLASDQPAVAVSGTVTVTPSGTQDVNLTKVVGTATDVNTGNAGAGTQRVVLASDQPAVAVTPAANSTVDVAKVGGTATVNGGLAGTLGVGGGAAVGAVPTTNPLPEGRLDSAGNLIIPDYCTLKATVSGATLITGSTQLVAVSALTTIRVCKWSFTTDTLTTAQLVTGTGATCTTPTAETGVYSGAGGGLFGVLEEYNSGPLITTAGKTLCIALSAGVTTTGGITIEYSQR